MTSASKRPIGSESSRFGWVSNRSILQLAGDYFVESARIDSQGLRLWDQELGDYASDCVALQCAGFLNRGAGIGGADWSSLAAGLLTGIYSRRSETDWFSIPYNATAGTRGEMDVAELGASSHALRSFSGGPLKEVAGAVASTISSFVQEFAVPDRPGQFRKSKSAGELDIPNANLYAALVLDTARILTDDQSLIRAVQSVVHRLSKQLGSHQPDRWPYSFNSDGTQGMGYSTAYQATIVGWGWILASSLNAETKENWTDTLLKAYTALRDDIAAGPSQETEAASWAANWSNVWEIRLAMASEGALDRTEQGLERLGGASVSGMDDLPKYFGLRRETVSGRNPVSTTLRKLANFLAIISALDEIREDTEVYGAISGLA